jgi:phosphoglycolate phosphatase
LYPHLDARAGERFRQHYADIYMALDQQPSPLFEGVVESLDAFRRGLSPGGGDRQGASRAGSGAQGQWLGRFFDITRAADETRGKPHPLMLEEILAHCGVEPSVR